MDLYEQPSGLYLPRPKPEPKKRIKVYTFTYHYESNGKSAIETIAKAGATYIQTLNIKPFVDGDFWDRYIILYAHSEELEIEELC